MYHANHILLMVKKLYLILFLIIIQLIYYVCMVRWEQFIDVEAGEVDLQCRKDFNG